MSERPRPRYGPGAKPVHRLRPLENDTLRYWVAFFMQRFLLFPACFLIYKVFHDVELRGAENFDEVDGRSFLLCPNHTSAWDAPVTSIYVFSSLRRFFDPSIHFTVLADPANLKFRILQHFFHFMGVIPVDRKAGIEQYPLQDAMHILRAGDRNVCLGIYPEGTRSRTGKLARKGKLGAGWYARRAGVPVVPMFHTGFPALPGFRKKVILRVGKPLYLEEINAQPDDPPTWAAATKAIMAALREMEPAALEEQSNGAGWEEKR